LSSKSRIESDRDELKSSSCLSLKAVTARADTAFIDVLDSVKGYTDIWWNQSIMDRSQTECFRPISIVMGSTDRMYLTIDAAVEGEVLLGGNI